MKIDCVFSGGGVKGFAFLGALQSIKEKGLVIERIAGTSTGAIIAALLSARYTVDEMDEIIQQLNLKKFLDTPLLSEKIPFSKWLLLYFQMGIYKGNVFEKWLVNILANKGIHTFKDIKEGYLKVVVSDVSLGQLIIIPDDLERIYGIDPYNFSVASAVRMSASFPYFFMPKTVRNKQNKKSYMIDGGVLSNFPLWIFRENDAQFDQRPVLGITLSDTMAQNNSVEIKNALDMLQALFQTMLRAHDTRHISEKMKDNIIFLPVKEIKTTDFMISKEEKSALIQLGKKKTSEYLQYWPK